MSNFQLYQATVVQPDLDGPPINLNEVRERLVDQARQDGRTPNQVFVVLGDGQTMLHPTDPERIYASGPAIVVIHGLFDRTGLSLHVLS